MENFNGGDHLVSYCGLVTHHGVYIGNDMVIHNTKEEGVIMSSLNEFGSYPSVRKHSAKITPGEIISRAYSRLGEKRYQGLTNGDECFANWCCGIRSVFENILDSVCVMKSLFK